MRIFTDNAPLTLTLTVKTLSGLIFKTEFCGLILGNSTINSMIIGVSNDPKSNEITKTTIGISEF